MREEREDNIINKTKIIIKQKSWKRAELTK